MRNPASINVSFVCAKKSKNQFNALSWVWTKIRVNVFESDTHITYVGLPSNILLSKNPGIETVRGFRLFTTKRSRQKTKTLRPPCFCFKTSNLQRLRLNPPFKEAYKLCQHRSKKIQRSELQLWRNKKKKKKGNIPQRRANTEIIKWTKKAPPTDWNKI